MHRVGAIILAGCFLLLPHTAVSVDPPSAFCQNPEQCFAGFLEALDRTPAPSGTSSEPVKYFQQIATKYSGTVWEKRAKLRYGYWLRTSAPLEAIPLLEASLNDYRVLAHGPSVRLACVKFEGDCVAGIGNLFLVIYEPMIIKNFDIVENV